MAAEPSVQRESNMRQCVIICQEGQRNQTGLAENPCFIGLTTIIEFCKETRHRSRKTSQVR